MTIAGRRWADLLEHLLRDGILHASPDQPVVSGTGRPAPWMLDSLGVSLDPVGSRLAAECLLEVLDQFEGSQLATYGVTALPLLMGCIHYGRGRYRGIVVRKQPRPHGSLKQIEGIVDPSEPVIIIDDSICSGYSMRTCAQLLEGAGLQVEGAASLVRFSYDPGVTSMLDRGYRMATVFDLDSDLINLIDGEGPYAANPTKEPVETYLSDRAAPEGLHPAELARAVMEEYLATGRVLGPPDTVDRHYDGAGGCFVSLRRRADVHTRPARSGFWHFPGEPVGTGPADLTWAAIQTARQLTRLPDPAEELELCGIAVTFFSALEECTVGELDNDRYGIVVRSSDRPDRMGGALPSMPGVAGERQQFAHALRNARLHRLEPYHLYRHDVVKVVEPGAPWHATGVPATAQGDPAKVARLAVHARQSVLGTRPATTQAIDLPTDTLVFVTVYAKGRLVGCLGGPLGPDQTAIEGYALGALDDDRFAAADITDPTRLAVSVSVLSNRHEIGTADPDWVAGPTRHGVQALEVRQGDRRALLLPSVAITHNFTPKEFIDEVIDKAGITRPPYHWTRYDVATALAEAGGVHEMAYGLPMGDPESVRTSQLSRLEGLLLGYVRCHHDTATDTATATKGPAIGRYEPFADRLRIGISGARFAYGAWVKARAGLSAEAADDVRRLEAAMGEDGWIRFDDEPASISELAFLVLAELELGDERGIVAGLTAKLWSRIDGHGRFEIQADGDTPADDVYQDYAPGQALLAAAMAARSRAAEFDPVVLAKALRYYRMRFRQNHDWGAVAWLAQAFAAWGRLTEDVGSTAFAYEIVDWALRFQSEKSGGFLNDHQPDSPGATTAVYLEAVAAVLVAANEEGDTERQHRYRLAADRGLRFLDRLVYQQRDALVLPNPSWAIGGVRTSLSASEVRIDYVQHALSRGFGIEASLERTMTEKPTALVSMPTLAGHVPSFQLALLTPTLERAGLSVEPLSLFLEFGRRIGWKLNDTLATVYPCMVGEWIWSKTAFGDLGTTDEYIELYGGSLAALSHQGGCSIDEIVRVRDEVAPAFIDWAVEEIDWTGYGLVGFSVVFQQMVASLALAKAIKRRHPEVPIIFGGATFEDDIAMEIMSRNPEVDFVHCGDADLSLPEIVSRCAAGRSMEGIRGVLWRDGDRIVYEGRAPNLEDLDRTPVPNFDEYFSRRSETGYDDSVPVMLPIETARGCWYGMKNHCTFCGLNRAGMDFRRKSPDQVLDMLKTLAGRYGTLYFNAIDNILAPAYISRLFDRLAEGHSDLRLHYEIRPNLSRSQLAGLRRGGLTSVQPGIESFSTHVLGLMKKGTTGVKNLELLKWTTYYGIANSYNILFGFPGETAADYRGQADLVRLIPHLQPPYAMCQARPDRGSPMYEQPAEHSITMLRPSRCYRYIYPPGYNLRRVSYFFEHQVADILPDGAYDECQDLVEQWQRQWDQAARPSLRYLKTWDSLSIHDRRGRIPKAYRYDDEWAAVYEFAADATDEAELLAKLGSDGEWLSGALREFVDRGLMVHLDGKYLALALPENPHY